MQEDEGEDDADFTPMSQDNPGGSRRTFSIDSIIPHRSVDPRPARPFRLGTTASGRLREKSSELLIHTYIHTYSKCLPQGSNVYSPECSPVQVPILAGVLKGGQSGIYVSDLSVHCNRAVTLYGILPCWFSKQSPSQDVYSAYLQLRPVLTGL